MTSRATILPGITVPVGRAPRRIGDVLERDRRRELRLDCALYCRCRGEGDRSCDACRLWLLRDNRPALLAAADDYCACEHDNQCIPCRIAATVRRQWRMP